MQNPEFEPTEYDKGVAYEKVEPFVLDEQPGIIYAHIIERDAMENGFKKINEPVAKLTENGGIEYLGGYDEVPEVKQAVEEFLAKRQNELKKAA